MHGCLNYTASRLLIFSFSVECMNSTIRHPTNWTASQFSHFLVLKIIAFYLINSNLTKKLLYGELIGAWPFNHWFCWSPEIDHTVTFCVGEILRRMLRVPMLLPYMWYQKVKQLPFVGESLRGKENTTK